MFSLVLITTLGAVTPLSEHETRAQCFDARKAIAESSNYTTACLQKSSPEQVRRDLQQSMEMMRLVLVGMSKTFAQFPVALQ